MTREESWEVEGVTLSLLRHITDLGYVVSVHRIPESLLGTVGAFVEMHAIDLRTDPITQQMARVGRGRGRGHGLPLRVPARGSGRDRLGGMTRASSAVQPRGGGVGGFEGRPGFSPMKAPPSCPVRRAAACDDFAQGSASHASSTDVIC
jgi:hypothetical protein